MLSFLLQVELVEPPEGSSPGDRVSVQGFQGEPDEQLNPKKKIFEQVFGQGYALAYMHHCRFLC